MVRGKIINIKNWLLDWLFPLRCVFCHALASDHSPTSQLCANCLTQIKIDFHATCAFCAMPSHQGKTCRDCQSGHALDYLRSVGYYNDPILRCAIWAFKYQLISPLAVCLGKLLAENWLRSPLTHKDAAPLIIPVPLHWQRKNWRSFNQSALLAQELGQHLKLAVSETSLTRPVWRQAQAEITDHQVRVDNITGVFRCNQPQLVKDQTIILVDDVATTASTLDQSARVLKEAGAKMVIGLVLARG